MKRFECRWVREPNPPAYAGKRLACSDDVIEVSKALLGDMPREVFLAWFLDGRHKILGYQAVHEGTGDVSLVDPGDVLTQVLLSGARAWIAVHNHPSGDPTPSPEDIALTGALVRASKLVRRTLLDHIIVSDIGHTSLAANGLMPSSD